jgi:integrase/recombinase XerD
MDASRIEISGPLAPHEEPVWSRLAARGYTALSIANVVRVMAHLSRWLVRERLPLAHLTTHEIARFLRHRRRAGYTCWLSRRGVKPILDYLCRPRPRRLSVAARQTRHAACPAAHNGG